MRRSWRAAPDKTLLAHNALWMDKKAEHVRTKAGSLRAADENYDYDQDQDKEGGARPGKDSSSGALTRLVFGARILSKPDEDAV